MNRLKQVVGSNITLVPCSRGRCEMRFMKKIRPTNTHFTGAHSLLPVPKEKKNELVRQETCTLIWSWKTEINNIRVIILHLKSDTVSVKRHRRSGSGEIYLVF